MTCVANESLRVTPLSSRYRVGYRGSWVQWAYYHMALELMRRTRDSNELHTSCRPTMSHIMTKRVRSFANTRWQNSLSLNQPVVIVTDPGGPRLCTTVTERRASCWGGLPTGRRPGGVIHGTCDPSRRPIHAGDRTRGTREPIIRSLWGQGGSREHQPWDGGTAGRPSAAGPFRRERSRMRP
ncbi:unnamed protein product [Arctogadus glacialis]